MFTFMLNHPVLFIGGGAFVASIGVGLIIAACILTEPHTDVTQLDGYQRVTR